MTLENIEHIVFDLDNTLWDFSGNSKRILQTMFEKYGLNDLGRFSFDDFHTQYKFRNEFLWREYAFGNVSRDEVRLNRFIITLNDFGVTNYKLSSDLADYYISHTRNQTDLLPDALEVLNYLKQKYSLHIITNGFEEVQLYKLRNSGIISYFKTITTAEGASALKPDKKIFDHALQLIPARSENCLYIGDSPEVDGHGALNAGLQFIWLNHESKENTYDFKTVNSLKELMAIL